MKNSSLFWGLVFLVTTLALYRFTPLKESLLKDIAPAISQSNDLINRFTQGLDVVKNYQWKLKAIDGTILDVSELEKKTLLVSLWKFPCKECKNRLDFLQNLYNNYKDKVTFLMIYEPKKERDIFNFMQSNRYTIPMYTIVSQGGKDYFSGNVEDYSLILVDQKGESTSFDWKSGISKEMKKELFKKLNEL